MGSSPLTRGKRALCPLGGVEGGLIPAHAGKTVSHPGGGLLTRAHPRSRGENNDKKGRGCRMPGSSPLTRGKLGVERGDRFACRLIPAHAGKTPGSSKARQSSRAHPRSRGENPGGAHARACQAGSSPLTRGKPGRVRDVQPGARLIPAHAGKTWGRTCQLFPFGAHPRSRGENLTMRLASAHVNGSSPLTRGKQRPVHRSRHR